MPSDPLLPLLDALLRLRNFDASELDALLQRLPADSPNATAIPEQPVPQEPAPPEPEVAPPRASTSLNTTLNSTPPVEPSGEPAPARETILVGCGEDDSPLDPEAADADEWSLPTEEESPGAQSQADTEPTADSDEPEMVFGSPAPELPAPAEAEPSNFEWDAVAATAAKSKPAMREDVTDRRLRQVMAWFGKGLFVWLLFLGSFFFGAWFLRSAPQSQLAGKTKPSTEKSREQTGKRREIRSADGDPMLAKEELIAAEDAQIAMGLIGHEGAAQVANAPNIHLDRNGLPQPDEGIVVFPAREDFVPQPNVPPEGSPGPTPVVESPPPSTPAPAMPAPLPIIIMPQGGGGFGPVAPRNKSQVAQAGMTRPATTTNNQSRPAANPSQSATNPGNSTANSNPHAHTSPSPGPTSPVNHVPPGRTPTPPGHSRSR
jgi:hypothetical protein